MLPQRIGRNNDCPRDLALPVGGPRVPLQKEIHVIGRLVSRYDMLERLDEGGMGVVFLAQDIRLGRPVAIKFLTATDPHYRSRFQREARVLSSFSHPNIATVHDSGETEEGRPFIVMELVSGSTLSEILDQRGLTLAQSVDIAISIAEALAEAHRHSVIHRDIKPANVIVNDRGHVKVIDFGLAKLLDDVAGRDESDQGAQFARTQSNVAVGTPLYFSPEQASSKPVDERSDLFSLGVLLYECIAGRSPFAGSSAFDIGAQVIHSNPLAPSKTNPRIPAALDRITLKALAKKPDDRYQTADELIGDLRTVRARLSADDQPIRRLVSGETTSPASRVRTSIVTTLIEPLRRKRLSWAGVLAGVAVFTLVVLAIVYVLRPRAHEPLAAARQAYDEGMVALRNGAFLQATKSFEKAIVLDNKFALAHARLAEASNELDYIDRARDELLRASTLVPNRSVYSRQDALYWSAINATVTRDFPQAIESYRQIVALNPEKPEAYADLGRAYEKSDDIKKAIESYVEASNRGPQYATAFLRLGYLYGRDSNLAAAEAAFSRAEELYQSQQNPEGRTEVFYQRGQLYNQLNKLPQARQQLQQALDGSRATGNEYQRIRTLLQLSSVAVTEGKADHAHEYATQAIELAQANGMETLIASGFIELGNIFLARGAFDEAEKNFDQALEYSRKYKIRRSEARALLSLASLRYQRFADPEKALNYANSALPFYQQGNYRKETAQALILIGRANSLQGNYAESLKAFGEQLQLAERSGDSSLIAQAHMELGITLVQQEQYPAALPHFQANYDINNSLGNLQSKGFSLTNRGNVLWQLGRYQNAKDAFAEATKIGDDGKFTGLLAWLSLTRARMALSEGGFPDAKREAEASSTLAGVEDTRRAAESKAVSGLAQILSGANEAGKRDCAQAFAGASQLTNQELLCATQLALAEALIETGDGINALKNAQEAQNRSDRLGKVDSQWRAVLIAARAEELLHNRPKAEEYALTAAKLLSGLEQKWGADSYQGYQTRSDIRRYLNQLKELSTQAVSKSKTHHNLKEKYDVKWRSHHHQGRRLDRSKAVQRHLSSGRK
jgi:tetratricopeptide (TPR) repeat protein/predicted Ser/Thr protein kinase